MDVKKEYFSYNSSLTVEEARKIASSKKPVLIAIDRDCSIDGKFLRSITVATSLYSREGYKFTKITSALINGNSSISKEFNTIEEAENWVSSIVEEIKQQRKKIIEKQKENEKYKEYETIIIE